MPGIPDLPRARRRAVPSHAVRAPDVRANGGLSGTTSGGCRWPRPCTRRCPARRPGARRCGALAPLDRCAARKGAVQSAVIVRTIAPRRHRGGFGPIARNTETVNSPNRRHGSSGDAGHSVSMGDCRTDAGPARPARNQEPPAPDAGRAAGSERIAIALFRPRAPVRRPVSLIEAQSVVRWCVCIIFPRPAP